MLKARRGLKLIYEHQNAVASDERFFISVERTGRKIDWCARTRLTSNVKRGYCWCRIVLISLCERYRADFRGEC